jgi:hypothetical protein
MTKFFLYELLPKTSQVKTTSLFIYFLFYVRNMFFINSMNFLIKTYHDLKSRFWITRKYEKIIYLRE